LKNAGLNFESIAPTVDEPGLIRRNRHWNPPEASYRLAKAKAVSVSTDRAHDFVIGADQILALDNQIFEKPKDRTTCQNQLKALRGRTHTLISTVVCAYDGVTIWHYRQAATLRMRWFTAAFLDDYLDHIGTLCTASVGGYQLERDGLQLFDYVEGDYFTILGLPMIPLLNFLRFVKAVPR
jgi:septum formation protein